MNKFLLVSALGSVASASQAFTYFQDFQGSVGAEWSTTSVTAAPADPSRKFLGQFGNNTATLSLTGLTPGQPVKLSFELFVIASWDGSGNESNQWGPDEFHFFGNSTRLMFTTFSNIRLAGSEQSYAPNDRLSGHGVPGGLYWAQTGADEVETLGFDLGMGGDSVYKMDGSGANAGFLFTPTSQSLVLRWIGDGQEGVENESWGIDNVRVQSVPEPASMAVLAAGALALVRMRRK